MGGFRGHPYLQCPANCAGLSEELKFIPHPVAADLWVKFIRLEQGQGGLEPVLGAVDDALGEFPASLDLLVACVEVLADLRGAGASAEDVAAMRERVEMARAHATCLPRGGSRVLLAAVAFERAAGDEDSDALAAALDALLTAPVEVSDDDLARARMERDATQPPPGPEAARARERARKEAQRRVVHEDRVDQARAAGDPTQLAEAFQAYARFEEAHGDPARALWVRERMVTELQPPREDLWLQHGRAAESRPAASGPRLGSTALTAAGVYARATRAVPASGALWSRRLRELERRAADPEVDAETRAALGQDHADTYAAALNAGLDGQGSYLAVVMARVDYLRHAAGGGRMRAAAIRNAWAGRGPKRCGCARRSGPGLREPSRRGGC